MHRSVFRRSKVRQLIKMLQLGFEPLVQQQQRFQRAVNIASALFNKSIDQVVD